MEISKRTDSFDNESAYSCSPNQVAHYKSN
jgi:hypothetical protein